MLICCVAKCDILSIQDGSCPSGMWRHGSAPSPRDAPELCNRLTLQKSERAQGRPGARCTRGLVCKMHKANAHEHTGSAETLRPSPRNGFTAYFVLSPVTGLSCHRRSSEALASQKLDTSVGVSGPHDFAVRNNIVRPHARSARRYHRVHRIPRPTSVTIAIRPSCGRETGALVALICPSGSAKCAKARSHSPSPSLTRECDQAFIVFSNCISMPIAALTWGRA